MKFRLVTALDPPSFKEKESIITSSNSPKKGSTKKESDSARELGNLRTPEVVESDRD